MTAKAFVAFDLGAESGRAMLATLENGRLELEEAHRFPNTPRQLPDGLHWDLLGLWGNLLDGLAKAAAKAREKRVEIVSLGVDTWGVDYGLVGKSGQLIGLPFAYRDPRNAPAMRKTLRKLGEKRIYNATGIQFMPFNTLYQLVAEAQREPRVLQQASRMLNIPDLLHYFFSGKQVNEATIASTTQMVDPRTGKWNLSLCKAAGIPTNMLGPIVPAGTRIGKLRADIARSVGLPEIDVITPGGHDTASAVAAAPVDVDSSPAWAYLSSGTWSLMGAELDKPVVTEASRKASFTNERGVGGKIRFLKNIAGLWLVQEVRRDLEREGKVMGYEQLTLAAAEAQPFRTLVDPGHAPFMSPGDMRAKIGAFARSTGQPEPKSPGEFVRACLESLALTYRQTMDDLEALMGNRIEVLHIVGGGGKNGVLNQMTADALGRPVIVGPYEATAIGNALTQAIGARQIKNLKALRWVVRASFDPVRVTPQDPHAFDAQCQRFDALVK